MKGKSSLLTPTTSQKVKEIVAVDFIEFDEIRHEAKIFIKEYRKTHPKMAARYGRAVWENSNFYVGRGVTRITMNRIAIPYLACHRLARYLAEKFPEYEVGRPNAFNTLSVRLR